MIKRHFMSKKVVYVGWFGHINEEKAFYVQNEYMLPLNILVARNREFGNRSLGTQKSSLFAFFAIGLYN